ncbi:excinuclease ABC subunit UvrC [Garciella nitratireducens]|uniref:UvrABC system protein C n=1 Tax=Garciella nitratireducens DSM 15102 TaxID=1121911 RepID=A0A1T4NR50_9FIRM|nr:excinuclease ABC subunit UvrC [Garciella nitratireducens]SJZ81684.1 Excinuclease ABC subunit C [Garciella nitratireducens DSM 15102]
MKNLQEQLKILPEKPGVYIMKDSHEEIIYIGKAVSLKNRVRQYFQSSKNHSIKVKSMVKQIADFEYIVTDSELEALILECNLIKKHRPRYNVLLKDDKTYPYIKVTLQETYPRILITRRLVKDGSKYFGPYTSSYVIKQTLEVIRHVYPIRVCHKKIEENGSGERPCLNYHIKQCVGPCTGNVDVNEYGKMIKEIIQILDGKQDRLLEKLKEKMQEASSKMEFEKAAQIRDQLRALEQIAQKQKMIDTSGSDQDVIAFARGIEEACVQIFFVRKGKLIGREHYMLDGVNGMERRDIMTQFMKQFYGGTPFIPREILLQEEIDDLEIIQQWLTEKREGKVEIKVPLKGEKRKLIEMVQKNALITLEQFSEKMRREKEKGEQALKELQEILHLSKIPYRIEGFDISNIQGTDSVGSMVVLEEGKPKKSDYRRFKIKWIHGANDYASMQEIVYRRFCRGLEEREDLQKKNISIEQGKFSKLPDVVMIDGGLGHVQAVSKVFTELELEIPFCGMVKDEKHRTRGLIYKGKEVVIDKNSELFKMITRLQDEAHRFAISYHQNLRGKSSLYSILDDIPNIGPIRKKALLRQFGGIDGIKNATKEQLKEIEEMNEKAVESIYEFFHRR